MKMISVSESALESIKRMGEQQNARIAELEAGLHALLDAADDSDSAQYGTLSTSFVSRIAREALNAPR